MMNEQIHRAPIDATRSAEPAKHQLRGFMVPARGVHDCGRAAVIAGPAQMN